MSGKAFARIATRLARNGLICGVLVVTAGGVVVTPQSAGQLNVCHAGSVQLAFTAVENAFKVQHPGVVVNDVSGGSVALAGRLAAGLQPCDVYAAADYLDIDLLLKPLGLADYTIVFAKGRMVLAYLATDPKTHGIAGPGDFKSPASIPQAVPDWYKVLLAPGVRISSSHPFLDPSGYRSHMIFQLAETYYKVPGLANMLLEHLTINAAGGAAPESAPTLGRDFNFQFTYEHSAAAAARNDPAYRYVVVPDHLDLSNAANNSYYAQASVTMPGIGPPGPKPHTTVPAVRVAWGLTILTKSPNHENANAFVSMLLGPVGTAAFNVNGPTPISPAVVSSGDYSRLPKSLAPLVTTGTVPSDSNNALIGHSRSPETPLPKTT